MNKQQGALYVFSGPSGAGKTSLLAEIIAQDRQTDNQLTLSISYTTRPARKNEIDGVDYFFVSKQEFKYMQQQQTLLESAKVYDYYYGTGKEWVEEQLYTHAKDIVLEIDVQGAMQIMESGIECCAIFIFPPSFDILEERLKGRQTDSLESIKKRLQIASKEMELGKKFHYGIINDNYHKAIKKIQKIMAQYRQKR